jgi:hypothetical protein
VVRDSGGQLQGPGPNRFDGGSESAWLDDQEHLHLQIRQNTEEWHCAEVYTQESLGHGTYRFTLAAGFEALDPNVVVGLFTYLDDTNEIDIEFARWGQPDLENGQYVIQPYARTGNIIRFAFDAADPPRDSTHEFTWCPDTIHFKSWWTDEPEELLQEWIYRGADIPAPSTERVHLNLWLMSGLAPTDGRPAEVVVKAFEFLPAECPPGNGSPLAIPGPPLGSLAVVSVLTLWSVAWHERRNPDRRLTPD